MKLYSLHLKKLERLSMKNFFTMPQSEINTMPWQRKPPTIDSISFTQLHSKGRLLTYLTNMRPNWKTYQGQTL